MNDDLSGVGNSTDSLIKLASVFGDHSLCSVSVASISVHIATVTEVT